MLINLRNALMTGKKATCVPFVMCAAPSGVSGFLVPWANGTDAGFKIEIGIYIPKTSSSVDGYYGYLYDPSHQIGYRIFSLTFDNTEQKTGFCIDTDTSDSGRRTVFQGTWYPNTNPGDYRGYPCDISYNNLNRSAVFSYNGTTYSNSANQGSKTAIFPQQVYLLNGVNGSYEHALIYCRYVSGQGNVLHDYIPIKSGTGVRLRDKITGLEYSPVSPQYYTYGELPALQSA